ncbi:hypothetical protein [Shewanella donghaensis]|uniref:hypothetical protein n=1 Tax=Shewanella donghaensis TaxID=238836 RepID=UPI00118390A9|nr:hypothetical protein [Shewanella donghaensis]
MAFKILLNLSLVMTADAVAKDIVILNLPDSERDTRYEYTHNIMELILIHTEDDFGEWEIKTSSVPMTASRVLSELVSGQLINVIAEAPKPHWNEKLIAIDVPLRKGIQGFRVFIIKQQNQSLFANITSFEQFKKIPTGSGMFWSTRFAMEQAEMNVVIGSSYNGLFHMLDKERFISFGRGINEAYDEVAAYRKDYPDLMVEKNTLLHIPLVTLFYVSPTLPELANRIQIGLQRIKANGLFDDMFYREHCRVLIQSQLDKRLVFTIDNEHISQQALTKMLKNNQVISPKSNFEEVCLSYLEE